MMTPGKRAKLERMAQAAESPSEAYAARRLLDMESPILRPIIERIEAWEALYGPCPECGHGYARHVGGTCYGAPGLMAVEVGGQKRAMEVVGFCPCHRSVRESGWLRPGPSLLTSGVA